MGVNSGDWQAIVSTIGSVGFAIWYGWYMTTYTLPKIAKEHRDAQEIIAQAHQRVIDRIIETFERETKEERTAFASALKEVTTMYRGKQYDPKQGS